MLKYILVISTFISNFANANQDIGTLNCRVERTYPTGTVRSTTTITIQKESYSNRAVKNLDLGQNYELDVNFQLSGANAVNGTDVSGFLALRLFQKKSSGYREVIATGSNSSRIYRGSPYDLNPTPALTVMESVSHPQFVQVFLDNEDLVGFNPERDAMQRGLIPATLLTSVSLSCDVTSPLVR